MSKKIKLADCPNCGSDSMNISVVKWFPRPYMVTCPECGYETRNHKRLKDAVRAWNGAEGLVRKRTRRKESR